MAIISLSNITVSFGGPAILENIGLQIEKNQRICVVGRNGSGKSTLLRLVAGEMEPDAGSVIRDRTLSWAFVPQHIVMDADLSVTDIVAAALNGAATHTHMTQKTPPRRPVEKNKEGTTDVNARIIDAPFSGENASSGEKPAIDYRVEKILSVMSLDGALRFGTLSGGLKRRTLLAAALVTDPSLLILDEPTNHLDLDAIEWLEAFLLNFQGTVLFVTHDRSLVAGIATRILEIDRGRLHDWECTYEQFLKRKEEFLDAQEKEWNRFDRKLSREEAWIRRGLKARRRRNEGRAAALQRMREQRAERREQPGTVSMRINAADASGKIVIRARGISFSYGEKRIVRDFSMDIMRQDRIGIVGSNGSGKTTLLSLLLNKITPDAGEVVHGVRCTVCYFDQLREQLDQEKTVWENVLPQGGDFVEINGGRKHIFAYLEDFLFTPERAKTRLRDLSGGERNRLLFAKLFVLPSNILVMDEPTNDLDIETLELLEEVLMEYEGTILLVSHDRAFLNAVTTTILALEGNGMVKEYAGGYDDWIRQKKENDRMQVRQSRPKERIERKESAPVKRKRTFKETKELERLPGSIESAEHALAELQQKLADPEFYKTNADVRETAKRLAELEAELKGLYARWEELESL